MTFQEVYDYYGEKFVNIERSIGLGRGVATYWKRTDHVPFLRQCQIELLTGGILKVGQGDYIDRDGMRSRDD